MNTVLINDVEYTPIHVSRNFCSVGPLKCAYHGRLTHAACSHPNGDSHFDCSNPPRIWVPVAVVFQLVKERMQA